jgi:energy-coupling factor transport system substrate-specific component
VSAPVRTVTTKTLLTLAVFGAVGAVWSIALTPLTTLLALTAPLVYAAVASLSLTSGMLALRWTRMPGAVLLTALITGLLVAAFNPLGLLVIIALTVPAAAIEAVFLAFRYRLDSRLAWVAAPAGGGAAIAALSLAVIEPSLLTPGFIALLFVIRIVAYIACARLSLAIVRALGRAGVRPRSRSLPRSQAE